MSHVSEMCFTLSTRIAIPEDIPDIEPEFEPVLPVLPVPAEPDSVVVPVLPLVPALLEVPVPVEPEMPLVPPVVPADPVLEVPPLVPALPVVPPVVPPVVLPEAEVLGEEVPLVPPLVPAAGELVAEPALPVPLLFEEVELVPEFPEP